MTDEELQSFCATDDLRAWLAKPFSGDQYTYATNGKYVVRVSKRDGIGGCEGQPKAPEVLDKWFSSLDAASCIPVSLALPDVAEAEKDAECDACEGRGFVHDCPDCQCKCDDCRGKGQLHDVEEISVEALGHIFRLPYLRKLLMLPGLKVAPTTKKGHPVLFTFDGGEAGLMPMTRPHDVHYDATSLLATPSVPSEQHGAGK